MPSRHEGTSNQRQKWQPRTEMLKTCEQRTAPIASAQRRRLFTGRIMSKTPASGLVRRQFSEGDAQRCPPAVFDVRQHQR